MYWVHDSIYIYCVYESGIRYLFRYIGYFGTSVPGIYSKFDVLLRTIMYCALFIHTLCKTV